MPIVIGAGLGGLTAAYYLGKRCLNPITVYESSKHLGGWIRSENIENENFIFEYGPRTIRPKGPNAPFTLALIEELGLSNKIHPILSTHAAAKKRMIYVNDELHLLPNSFIGLFKKQPPFSKPLILDIFHDLKVPKMQKRIEDESIYNFMERRFGTEIAKYAISSLICGICAGDAKEISVRFLMNDLFEKEQKYGGVIKGMIMSKIFEEKNKKPFCLKDIESNNLLKKAKEEKWSIYSLKGGLQTLPATIAEQAMEKGIDIQTDAECLQINFHGHKAVANINGNDRETDYIISSIPSYKLGSLLEKQHPLLASELKAIPYVDVAVVNLRFSTPNLLQEEAFGFLVPPSEKLPILGVIFDSCCFQMKDNTVLTVMLGGKWFEEYFGQNPSKQYILDIALKYVRNILKIRVEPANSKVNVLRKCIPQYTVGHRARVQNIRDYIRKNNMPLSVCGAAYDGVGVNDVVFSAINTVYSILDNINKK